MFRGYLVSTLLLLLILGTARTATAQCPNTPSWNENIQAQLTHDLADTSRQDATLSLTLDLARRDCLTTADAALVDRLIDIYADADARNQHQMLSAVIVGELGDHRGLSALQRLVEDEESETVQKVTRAVLQANQFVAMK